MWRHKQRETPPAEIISIVEQCTEAGAKTPTFSSPIPDEPPYHTQMFPIKGTHKPLHPEYVNQDEDPFKQRDSANCTLLLSFSFFYNTHFKTARLPPLFFFFISPPLLLCNGIVGVKETPNPIVLSFCLRRYQPIRFAHLFLNTKFVILPPIWS